MAVSQELLQDLAPDLKRKLKEGVKKQKVKIHCSECSSSLGSWSVSGLGAGKTFKCKNKDCGHSTKVDMRDVKKVINVIDSM